MVAYNASLVAEPVRVLVPARDDFVAVLRGVATAVAERAAATFDDVADLRLLVDEASARILAFDAEPTALGLDLRARPDGFEMLVWSDAAADHPWPPEDLERSLGWRVLTALSDEIGFERCDGGPAIRILKRVRASTGGR